MKGLLYRKSIPRYLLLRLLASRFRGLATSRVSPVVLCDLPEPSLPTGQWVRIAPVLAGICGSDIATLLAKASPYLAPVTSTPFILGHEVVGTITEVGEDVDGLSEGDRVVLRPALGCRVRGITDLCDACAMGRDALCRNVTRGDISAGIQTGYCRDTGGAFGDNFVAHQSQAYRIPDEIDDRAAVLIEPFACALHGVLRVPLTDEDTVLVLGCGAIGLLTIAALRALNFRSRIVASAKYEHQRHHALAFGADTLIDAGDSIPQRYAQLSKALDAQVLDPELGKPTVIGGASVTFDCVASAQSIDDGMRFTRSAGNYVLVGMPGAPPKVDWTPMWFKELTIRCAYAYGPESHDQGVCDTFAMAIDLMKGWGSKLQKLVSSPFDLSDYREAFSSAMNSGRTGVAKTIFAMRP